MAAFEYPSVALLAAACSLLPAVLHWAFRRRQAKEPWPSLVLLRRAFEKLAERNQWRQVSLVALRGLAVLLLGWAVARPISATRSFVTWNLLPAGILAHPRSRRSPTAVTI